MARLADAALALLVAGATYQATAGHLMLFGERLGRCYRHPTRPWLIHEVTCGYALRAYPRWLRAHPTEDCPARLDDLASFTRYPDLYDPGTAPYRMSCDPATHRMVVWSEDDPEPPGTTYATAAANDLTADAQRCDCATLPL